jgi:hypothetical protein
MIFVQETWCQNIGAFVIHVILELDESANAFFFFDNLFVLIFSKCMPMIN